MRRAWLLLLAFAAFPAFADGYRGELGVRGSGLALEGSPSISGVGLGARLRLSEHWSAEATIDRLSDAQQNAVFPASASLLRYLAPSSPISLYVLGGAGASYLANEERLDLSRIFGHVGLGIELKIKRVVVSADARYLVLDHQAGDPIQAGLVANMAEGQQLNAMLGYRF
jgi:hypothetical protein